VAWSGWSQKYFRPIMKFYYVIYNNFPVILLANKQHTAKTISHRWCKYWGLTLYYIGCSFKQSSPKSMNMSALLTRKHSRLKGSRLHWCLRHRPPNHLPTSLSCDLDLWPLTPKVDRSMSLPRRSRVPICSKNRFIRCQITLFTSLVTDGRTARWKTYLRPDWRRHNKTI